MKYTLARALTVAAVALAVAVGDARAASIPTPKQFYGFEMGTEGKLPAWGKTKQYFQLLAARSNRVDYAVQSKTVEGDDYPYLLISAPKNLQRIDQIVAANQRLANPRGLTDEQAKELAASSPPVYMIESMIHSNEVANSVAIVDVVHRFATEQSAYVKRVLDNAVLLVVPSGNPDGWRKMIDYFDQTAGTDYARTYPDLYHHYVGHDDNRDWFMFTQPETRARVRLAQRYRPVVLHVMHQQGAAGSRIFVPPYQEPLSPDVDPITIHSANALGLAAGRALTAEGKKGVQHSMGTQNSYGIFWSADVAGYETFLGSSLLLTETAGQRDLAYMYTSQDGGGLGPQGRSMDVPDPYRGSTWTLEQAMEYAESALYATLDTVTLQAASWQYNNLYQVARNGVQWEGGPYAYVLPAEQRDPYALYEMLKIFEFGKVEIDRATAPLRAGGKTYSPGSYVLRTQQPLGRWIDQLLNNPDYPSWAKPCSTCPLTMPYSEFTDTLPLMLGVEVDAVQDPFSAKLERVSAIEPAAVLMPQPPPAAGAYVVQPDSYGVSKLLAALQEWDVPTFRAADEFSADGRTFAPGTVIVPPGARARSVLQTTARETGLQVYAVAESPRVAGFRLKPGTRVGLVRGANNMPGGWMMWLLENFGIDYEVVSADDYADGRLSVLYDTIVLADGVSRQRIVEGLDMSRYPDEFSWARGAGEDGWDALAAFVQEGGNLVAIGSASETAQALLNLPVQKVSTQAPFRVGGSLLRMHYDSDVPAAWGMPDEWATYFKNDRAFTVLDDDAQIAAAYPGTGAMLASGYEEGASQLRGKADVVSFDVGEGSATIAGSQITFRSWPRALWPIVANAIYQGPSTAVSADRMARR